MIDPAERFSASQNTRLIETATAFKEIPWLIPENLTPANFHGSTNSEKFILKSNPEVVVRISGYQIYPTALKEELEAREFAFREYEKLRNLYGIRIPPVDYRVVDPQLLHPGQTDTYWDYEVVVKTDLIHGQSLDTISNPPAALVAEADKLVSNLIQYYLDEFMAKPRQNIPALADLESISQYMWGATAANPAEPNIYLSDIELYTNEFEYSSFIEGIYREITNIYWTFIVPFEKKAGLTLNNARHQLELAISLIAQLQPEIAATMKSAINVASEDEYDKLYFY